MGLRLAAVVYGQPVIGQDAVWGKGFPSAKLGTAAVVSNTTAASTSKSFFMVWLLFWGWLSLVTLHNASGRWDGKASFGRFSETVNFWNRDTLSSTCRE